MSLKNKQKKFGAAMFLLKRYKRKNFVYKMIIDNENGLIFHNSKKRKSLFDSNQLLTSSAKFNIHEKNFIVYFLRHDELLQSQIIDVTIINNNNLFDEYTYIHSMYIYIYIYIYIHIYIY